MSGEIAAVEFTDGQIRRAWDAVHARKREERDGLRDQIAAVQGDPYLSQDDRSQKLGELVRKANLVETELIAIGQVLDEAARLAVADATTG